MHVEIRKVKQQANMPLPEDKAVVETAGHLVNGLRGAFGTPADYRPGE